MTTMHANPSLLSRVTARSLQVLGFWLACAGVAFAYLVTAEQVAAALANSPYASPLLRNNSTAVGALAIFESGGETTVYNGSCCYGVLQMSTTNIQAAGYTPAQFAALSLQAQVDAWAQMQSRALNAGVVSQLQAMGTFDGQRVDFPFLLACVQLGQGNCATMVASGTCAGFADRNGTTICGMAARMRSSMGIATPPPTGGAPAGNTSWTRTTPAYTFSSVGEAFSSGSGSDMGSMASMVRALLLSLTLLLCGVALIAHFGAYAEGQQPIFVFVRENIRVVTVSILVMVVLI